MLSNTLHHRWSRWIACIAGQFILAAALRLFIVPLGLYNGGLMGSCQLIRTLLQTYGGLDFGTQDIAGILYFILNIPILLIAWRNLGRDFVSKTIVATVSFSFFYSIIPSPSTPIVNEFLTGCLLGGLMGGCGNGLALTAGGSGGGLDIIGLVLSKRGSRFTVGRFSLTFNAFFYTICLLLFSPEIAIYSVIYNFTSALTLDRMHQQNISVQATIFTRGDEKALSHYIIETVGRGVTCWAGRGAYTDTDLHVLCVCLSKYEIDELNRAVHEMDPHAFVIMQEGVHIYGNFLRKLS